MSVSIFDFSNYQTYLNGLITSAPKKGRGLKSQLSQYINCQTTYLSQVLVGKANFNIDQAEACARFFKLSRLEKKFFLTLVQLERSGNFQTKEYLKEELQELKEQSFNLKKRFEVKKSLGEKEQETYYSHWLYAAVHVLTSIPHINSVEQIASILRIPLSRAEEVLNFLLEIGLVKFEDQKLIIGPARLHLASDSHLVYHHHRNWRIHSLLAIDRALKDNLHYSSVVTLSKKDMYKVKNYLIEAIKDVKKTISDSVPEEECCVLNLDFYGIDHG